MLVLGLYRLRDVTEQTFSGTNARYVLTYPAEDTPLFRTDLVYCLEPFRGEPDYYTRLEAEDARHRDRDSAAAATAVAVTTAAVGESKRSDTEYSNQSRGPSGSTEAVVNSTRRDIRALINQIFSQIHNSYFFLILFSLNDKLL